MPPGFDGDRMPDNLLEFVVADSVAQCGAYVDFVIAEQAEVQPSVGSQAHAVAGTTKRLTD